ncbi:MAG TPA: fluoride efflux transporter CrcB [Bryobacteraceae bacterium]|nr:fluoride efflux transporter CrcB [Bryobacteraceae bacterium]
MKYLLIVAGGGIGSLVRYAVGTAIMSRAGTRFPLGTMFINITGSFLIGLMMTLIAERLPPSETWRPLLVIGFLGGYTTFSSFEWETYSVIRDGSFWLGLLNVAGSVSLGYAAVWLGSVLARR